VIETVLFPLKSGRKKDRFMGERILILRFQWLCFITIQKHWMS